MKSYFKLALKVLTRRKFFTLISLFGISLTLVVLVVATAILDDIFSPTAPESRFDRALLIFRVTKAGRSHTISSGPGYGFIRDYVLNMPDVEMASAFSKIQTTAIYQNESRIDTKLRRTDANYWRILDFRFVEGRPFGNEEEAGGALVAVITDKLGQKLFGQEGALGKRIDIDGRRFQIIGVVPAVSSTRLVAYSEVWVPHTSARSSDYQREFIGDFSAMVLARRREDLPRLQRIFQTRMQTMPLDDPKVFTEVRAWLDTPFEALSRLMGPAQKAFRENAPTIIRAILAVLALLFMTLPTLNLVTLNLSRIMERSSEIGVRKAFGAPRRALLGQFVLENVILTLIGAAAAFVLSAIALAWINDAGFIPDAQLQLNIRTFMYGTLLALVFGVVSGVYPAWRMSRLHPVTALRGGA